MTQKDDLEKERPGQEVHWQRSKEEMVRAGNRAKDMENRLHLVD